METIKSKVRTQQTVYEQWCSGNYSNPGGFELAIFEAYTKASSGNQDKLIAAFPNFFAVETKKTEEPFKFDERASSPVRAKRTSKKEQYTNGIEYDIKFYEENTTKDSPPFFFHHGTRVHKYTGKRILEELREELKKVNEDKNYKPWKE